MCVLRPNKSCFLLSKTQLCSKIYCRRLYQSDIDRIFIIKTDFLSLQNASLNEISRIVAYVVGAQKNRLNEPHSNTYKKIHASLRSKIVFIWTYAMHGSQYGKML